MGDNIVDFSVIDFKDYNAYINSFVTIQDRRYLGDQRATSYIVKLGYRTTKIPYTEQEFQQRQAAAFQAIRPKFSGVTIFGNFMKPNDKDPVLIELRRREIPNLNKILSSIVFTTFQRKDSSLISGYLDLEHSWRNAMRDSGKHTDWQAIFEGRARLKPQPHHLSYSNAHYNIYKYTPSDNYLVLHDHKFGLLFMHKGDQKIISVGGTNNKYSQNAMRSMVFSPKFGYVIFYDHIVRKKV